MTARGATPQALTAAQADTLQSAFGLLRAGRAAEAAAMAAKVIAEAPRSPDAQHLLALCLGGAGDTAGAESAFMTALALAPDNPQIRANHANFLSRAGRLADALEAYRTLLVSQPRYFEGWLNYGLLANRAGETLIALDALQKAVALNPAASIAWQGLGNARRDNDDFMGAEAAFRESVRLDPNNGLAWLNLGVILRLLGDPAGALPCYDEARRAGFDGPERADAEASALLDLGEYERALPKIRALTVSAPAYVPGHELLAHVIWEYGGRLAPGEAPTDAFRAAASARPNDIALNLAFANFLIESTETDEAIAVIRRLRSAGESPHLVAAEANALEIAGRHDEAAGLFETAYPAMRRMPAFLNIFSRHRLKTRKPDAAARLAEEAVTLAPNNQEAWAYLSTAWRLLDDPREFWLCNYEKLIAAVDVPPPPGFPDVAAFIADLEATLEPMHTAERAPVNQSLRDGSQTSGSLFGRRNAAIAAAREALRAAVEARIAQLPDDSAHPFLSRKLGSVQFTGSWSVRLWRSGRHVNHFHPRGWMSSAFYVTLPPSVHRASGGDRDRSGWIQFGEPPVDLGLDLAPRRVIKPEIGRLALFPSYMWHGTVPFEDDSPRMTVAFDMVPAAKAAVQR